MGLVMVLSVGLAGCGSKDQDTSLQKVKDKGTLVVGTSADYAPFEFPIVKNGKKQITGYDILIAKQIAKDLGMEQISDPATLTAMVTEVLDANEQSVEDFKNGKDRAIGFLVGQIMKKSKGQANPKMVNEILLTEIKKR